MTTPAAPNLLDIYGINNNEYITSGFLRVLCCSAASSLSTASEADGGEPDTTFRSFHFFLCSVGVCVGRSTIV